MIKKVKSFRKPQKTLKLKPKNFDFEASRQVLIQKHTYESLDDLTVLAEEASRAYESGDSYEPASEAFCDGLEFKLGAISKNKIS